ncbi:MAG TPA: PhzF family phenazine biosynthesis protein [Caulobacteraceae bacterium]|jgi:PhzF family phenazine biosynthesis protein|nr:PhzF family phenazine biosynthesis protein [Caulobacteraceae bacterium]
MRQWTIDAFASTPFKGNPACVVEPFDAWPETAWMQALAAENNLSETAFLLRTADPARFGLRWMTPTTEVALCGHATLASGHALFEELGVSAETLSLDTQSGRLSVRRAGERLEMDFPASPPRRVAEPAGLAEALGAQPVEVWAARYLVAILEDEGAVRSLKPDVAAVGAIRGEATGGRGNVGVAALADGGASFDVVDRFFAPGSGIPEDPVCGSLHCILAPLFAERLGKPVIRFHQAYPGRGGDIETEMEGKRVLLRGRAVTVAESRLRL